MPESQAAVQEGTESEASRKKPEAKAGKATKKKPSAAPAAKKSKTFSKDELIAAIKDMTVVELADLVKALEEEFGISAAAPVAVAAAPSTPGAEEAVAPVEEKTEFTVILKGFGESKINVIKAVREVTTLGLKEAKELVESAPKAVKEGINKEEAATVKEKLEAAGATIEIK